MVRTMVKHALEIAGTTNFRDLGGYATATEKRVRPGCVYRSESLHNVPVPVVEKVLVGQLHLTHSFDFRSPSEVAQQSYDFPHVRHVLLPIEGSLVKKAWHPGLVITPQRMRELIQQTYVNRIDDYAHQFAAVLQFLAGPSFHGDKEEMPQSVVFHCTAGKDRTGIMAGILLDLLGVPRPTILEDYLLSNELFQIPTEVNPYYDVLEMDPETYNIFWSVDAAFLNAVFAHIDSKYGGIEHYAHKKLLLDAEAVRRLRARLLE